MLAYGQAGFWRIGWTLIMLVTDKPDGLRSFRLRPESDFVMSFNGPPDDSILNSPSDIFHCSAGTIDVEFEEGDPDQCLSTVYLLCCWYLTLYPMRFPVYRLVD